jgi:hypothetical protein
VAGAAFPARKTGYREQMKKSSRKKDQEQQYPGMIVAAQHIEHLPQTCYKDFKNRVKKLFLKGYNQYRLIFPNSVFKNICKENIQK